MENNIALLNYCFEHPEETHSQRPEALIIPPRAGQTNDLLATNAAVIESITAYKVAAEQQNEAMKTAVVARIVELLSKNIEGIRFSEFVRFWKTRGLTFSMFTKDMSLEEKRLLVQEFLEAYLKERHDVYTSHGYTATTLQAIADGDVHKQEGRTGNRRIGAILEQAGFRLDNKNVATYVQGDRCYFFPDDSRQLLRDVLHTRGIPFLWAKSYHAKIPDCVFVAGGELYLLEHKFKKESGGGQDNELVQLVDLIKFTDAGVHYVGFLEGAYFNKYKTASRGKVAEQLSQIREALQNNPQNYFVNTAGLKKLLRSIVKD